jgi:hypothetical protein
VAQLVDDEVLAGQRVLHEDQVSRGVAAEAAKARYAEKPGRDDDANATQVDRLGIETKPVQASLRPLEQLAPAQGRGLRLGCDLRRRK